MDILQGLTLVSVEVPDGKHPKTLKLCTSNNGVYRIDVEDEGGSGNDSNAFFRGVELEKIVGNPITRAYHKDKSRDGVMLILETKDARGSMEIVHENNGYYGFSYEVVTERPDRKPPLTQKLPITDLGF